MKTLHSGKNRLNGKLSAALKPIKLDIACGQSKRDGFVGIDIANIPTVDIVHDLLSFPWPFKDNSVEEAHCSHFFEHVPGRLRFKFMDEVWRILVPEGKILIIVPYWSSMRSVQDPTHEWPPVCENSFLYFYKEWRKVNKLDHYKVSCDFDFATGYTSSPELATRNPEAQAFAAKNYTNAIQDLYMTLTKKVR